MNEKIFLTCQCGMLVGCFVEGQTNLFCDECESRKALECTVELGNAGNIQKELFAENCEYCQIVVVIDPKDSPAFLST